MEQRVKTARGKRAAKSGPTDIETFVDAPGRQKAVAEVRKKIDELGIEYLYLQFVSVTGRICGKGIPADHWESVAEKGFQLVYGATMNLFLNRRGDYLGYGPEAAELVGIPEPETFMQLPWDKRVARLWCTLFRNREEREDPGAFLTADARGNLRRIHDEFKKEHGLQLRHGTEPEMMWLKKDENGQPNGGYSNPYCYHIDQFESLRPVYMRVIEYCRKMGLDMIQGDHEDSPGQLELNFTFDDALRTADRLSTYRQICAQVAREFGIIACFMCKPFMGVSANGCHHNISLWRGGKDEIKPLGNDAKKLPGAPQNFMYARGGDNTFMPDTDDVQLPGKVGLRAIGGIVKHLGALTAIGCSTVNSYRRLWDTGFWAPVFSDWGFQNRTTGLRVSAPGRFEYRAVDAMVNPHLMAAALIKAMDDGLKNNLDPGAPGRAQHLSGDGSRQAGEEAADDARRCARGAEEGRRHPLGDARRDVPPLRRVQARRVGALHGHRDRMGHQDLSRLPAVTGQRAREENGNMCGIAGLIHRDGATSVGKEMTAMLKSLKHRGPNSTGFAIYGPSTANEYVMRLKLAEQEDMTKDHHIRQKIRERQAEVDRMLAEIGAETVEVAEATPYAFRYRLRYAGDTRRLATDIEQIEGAEVLSFGSALELIKDLGDATQVSDQYGLGKFRGTHGIGHTRMATESDVDIRSAHPYWAYPYNDIAVVHNGQITNYWIMRREMERLGHRFMSNCDSELLAVYTANNLEQGATLEDSLKASIKDIDGVFTYVVATENELGMAKDTMAAKPMVLFESDDLVALASEEVAIRAIVPHEIDTSDPYDEEVRVWQR